ncbi:MAG: type II secretion system protein [Phycisphaerae bacterium]|nr:type II secretion system protein [Phycisphaerae bacterium]
MRDRKTGFIPLETSRQGRPSGISNISSLTGFTPTPICIAIGQVKTKDTQFCRQNSNSLAIRKLVRGFTLVELLVVMAIIAMLTGILMPALAATRRIAYKTLCKENLHGCAIGFRMYLDDNKNVMPTITNMPNAHLADNPIPIFTAIGKYLGNPEVLKCPADKGTVIGTSFFDRSQAEKDANCYFREQGSSYEYNTRLANQVIEKSRSAQRFSVNEIYLLRDYSAFHGTPGRTGSVMYLYADSLVADRERDK